MTEPRKERDGDIDGRPDVDGIWAFKARDMNRVSKTWFSSRRHVEKKKRPNQCDQIIETKSLKFDL